MNRLHELIGVEVELARVPRALRELAQELGAPAVGVHHITCSDEVAVESAEALQQWFSDEELPDFKPQSRAAFRTANLGARYEFGSIRVAEDHYATHPSRDAFKLMVLKIDTHVGRQLTGEGPKYGSIDRYGLQSTCCGALTALLGGASLPALDELQDVWCADGYDRLAALNDEDAIPAEHRLLLAAVVAARLQAGLALQDIEDHRPETPTIYLVLPCVTINSHEPGTEILVGQYAVDATQSPPTVKYHGLHADPAAYRVKHEENGRAILEDDHWPS
jgi:hypothetical protein